MKVGTLLQVALSLYASSALAESPAKLICDGFDRSSPSDQAARFVRFSQSIDSDLGAIDPRDQGCLATKLDSLEEDRRAYCEARSSLGHDLAAGPLSHLTTELFSASLECSRPRREAEIAFLKESTPESCEQLLSSLLAYATFYETTEPDQAAAMACYRAKAPEHAPPLAQACAEGVLSVRAAYVELGTRVSASCKSVGGP